MIKVITQDDISLEHDTLEGLSCLIVNGQYSQEYTPTELKEILETLLAYLEMVL